MSVWEHATALAAVGGLCGALGCAPPAAPVPSRAPPQPVAPPRAVSEVGSPASPAPATERRPDAGAPTEVELGALATLHAANEFLDLNPSAPPNVAVANDAPATAASVRSGATQVAGRLSPERVQRGVQTGSYRRCYELALMWAPSLAGRLTVRFVIGPDGRVKSAVAAASDLPDPTLVRCVVAVFAAMVFPKPEGGDVVVTYPLVFRPADTPPSKSAPAQGPTSRP